jgi:hypothetical protein
VNSRRKNIDTKYRMKQYTKDNLSFKNMMDYLHNQIQVINNSKIFAGLMIVTLNIASRFVTINLSKSMESYLKHTFSRQLLVFTIAWMGTRDIYIATVVTVGFIIMSEYLFNEDSAFCILSESFQDYHNTLSDNSKANDDKVSDEEIAKAKEVLEKASKLNKNVDNEVQSFSMK